MCFRGIDIISDPGTRTRRGWRDMNYRDVVCDSDCTYVRRAKTSLARTVHTISAGPLLLLRCASPREDAVFLLSRSWSLLKRRAFLSALGLSGGGFVFGDKHRLRTKCGRSRLLEIACKLHLRHFLSYFLCLESRSRKMSIALINFRMISRIVNLTEFYRSY